MQPLFNKWKQSMNKTEENTTTKKVDITKGYTFTTNEGCEVEVLEVTNSRKVLILFPETGNTLEVSKYVIKTRSIKNPMRPSVCSVGFLGVGEYTPKEHLIANEKWRSMIQRCYGPNPKPTYIGTKVCETWHNFQNFAHWFYNESNYQDGFELDKDILGDGAKKYSPENCLFIPKDANNAYQKGVDGLELSPSEISRKDPGLAKATIYKKQYGIIPEDEALRLKKFLKIRATRYQLMILESDHPLIKKAIEKLDEKDREVDADVVRIYSKSEEIQSL